MVKGTKQMGASGSRKGGLGTARKQKRQVIFYLEIDNLDKVPNCSGMDSTLFVGPDSEGQLAKEAREAEAKRVCRGCPLATECATWAMDMNERGIWGGLDEDERRALKRRRSGLVLAKSAGELTTQQQNRIVREARALEMDAAGVSRTEIARQLGITEGTVYEYIRSSRKAKRDGQAGADHEADHETAGAPSDRPADSVGSSDSELMGV